MEENEVYYVILNMNCQYEICRKCPKSGIFKGTHKECEAFIEGIEFYDTPLDGEYKISVEEPKETYYVGYDLQDNRLTWCNTRAVFKHVYYECNNLKDVYDYINSHMKFKSIMKAYELGKRIQCSDDNEDWYDVSEPKWDTLYKYRVKPDEGLNECEVKEEDEPGLVKAKTKDCNITVDRYMLVDTILALQTNDRVSKITIWDSPYSGFTVTFTVIDE